MGILNTELKSIFAQMRDGSKNDAWLAEKMSAAIKKYIASKTVTTTDTGAAPAGAYAGAGTGTMTIDDGDLSGDLSGTFDATQDNDFLSENMSANIDDACKADDTVATKTSGTVTTPAGVSSVYSGTGKGKFTGEKIIIQNLLDACFSAMNAMSSRGDDFLAAQIEAAVDLYLSGGTVDVTLQTPLSGTGAGGIA